MSATQPVVEARHVGAAIKAYREAQGWSQSDLAACLGRNRSSASRLEAGYHGVHVNDLINGLGVDGACTVLRVAAELAQQDVA